MWVGGRSKREELYGSNSKESACSAGDLGWADPLEKEMATHSSILVWRSLGEGNGHPLQYSCLENFMDRGAWWATVNGVMESNPTERLTFSLLT